MRSQRTPDFLPIDFLIVGGAITGLSCAISLARVGHRVTVIEPLDPFKPVSSTVFSLQDSVPDGCVLEQSYFDAGIPLPPNSTKVYYRWGLEQRMRKCMIRSQGTFFASCEFPLSHETSERRHSNCLR